MSRRLKTGLVCLCSTDANGLIITPTGDNRTVSPRTIFFTSSRVVQYALDDFNPKQLLADFPFLTDNRTDIVGRDYGLVAQDPAAPDLVAAVFGERTINLFFRWCFRFTSYLTISNPRAMKLQRAACGVAGTSVATVLQDVLYKRETCNVSGTLGNEWSDCTDAWGGIERHVTLYNTASNVLVDKFFSLAHDPSRSVPFQLFENRTACVNVAVSTNHESRACCCSIVLAENVLLQVRCAVARPSAPVPAANSRSHP